MLKQWRFILVALMAMIVMVVGGCGGGGGGGTASNSGGTTYYSVSGTVTLNSVPLAGVTVSTGSSYATTDNSGNYTITQIANGSYTLTPSLSGYTFTPPNQAVTVNGGNLTGKNFSATVSGSSTTYSISGTVTSGGVPMENATVLLTGSGTTSVTTNSSGNYTFTAAQNGTYTITPTKSGYTFTPATLSVTVSGANLTGKNFTATTGSFGTITGTIQLPKTGQTLVYAANDDGSLQKGVAWPSPRFTNNSNGTVTDNLTGLIWLLNTDCTETVGSVTPSSGLTWVNALTWSNNLATTKCGLSDGSTVGQWRLPNVLELDSLVDIGRNNPALTSGYPFTGVQSTVSGSSISKTFWSSSRSVFVDPTSTDFLAWSVDMEHGYVYSDYNTTKHYVWPVRGGQ